MRNQLILPVLLMYALVWLLSGCFVLDEPEASSGTVVAPTLAVVTSAPVEEAPTEAASAPAVVETETPVEEPTAVEPAATGGITIFSIDSNRSEARFTIDEVLRSTPTVVIGISSNLAGQVAVDPSNPAATQVGEIVINARDFATDNDFRNRAIANEILLTDDYEFITFVPTELTGLPDSVTPGESYTFQIVGDLTMLDVTRSETFDITVTWVSETELQGLAVVTIAYADYGITVPLSQAVTAVEDEVLLELDFVAVAQ